MILITVLEFLFRPSNLVSDIPMVPPWRPADVQRDLMKGLEQVHSSKSNDNTMFTTLTTLVRSVASVVLLAILWLIWLGDLLARCITYVVVCALLLLAIIVALVAALAYYLCTTPGRRDVVESCKQTYHKLRATRAKESTY
jgi:hypothetical protein